MAIDITFKFWAIVAIKEASKQKGVLQARSARKIIGVEVAVIFNYFNSRRVGDLNANLVACLNSREQGTREKRTEIKMPSEDRLYCRSFGFC